MNSLVITGTIDKIFPEKHISERFNIREFVLRIGADTPYPQPVLLTLVNKNCDLIANFHAGDTVNCCFNVRGKEKVNKQGEAVYFNSIEVWRIYK